MAPRPRKGKIAEPTGFSSLSKTEQIRYLLTLWDRISKRPGEIPVPESHLDLAKERLAAHQTGSAAADLREPAPAFGGVVLIQFTLAEVSLWRLQGLGELGGAVIRAPGMVMMRSGSHTAKG